MYSLVVILTFMFTPLLFAQAQVNTVTIHEFQVNGVSKTTIGNDGNVMVTGTPTAGQQLTTKTYVDNAVASAGGAITYMGVTTATSDGILTSGSYVGLKAADAICAAQYAGSRFMHSSDYKYVQKQMTSATPARMHCDDALAGWCSDVYADVGNIGANCTDWTSSSSIASYNSILYTGSTGLVAPAGTPYCFYLHPLHCVKD